MQRAAARKQKLRPMMMRCCIPAQYVLFVPALNIRPVAGALPPRYELAEIVALQALRDAARERRTPLGL